MTLGGPFAKLAVPREFHADARATFGTVRREYAPLVRFGDLLDEREPEAHRLFAVFAVGRPLVERLEHPALPALLEPGAVVPDHEPDGSPSRFDPHLRHPTPRARRDFEHVRHTHG